MSPPSKLKRLLTGLELIVRLARIDRSTAPNKKTLDRPETRPDGGNVISQKDVRRCVTVFNKPEGSKR